MARLGLGSQEGGRLPVSGDIGLAAAGLRTERSILRKAQAAGPAQALCQALARVSLASPLYQRYEEGASFASH